MITDSCVHKETAVIKHMHAAWSEHSFFSMELNEERQEHYFIVARRSKKGLSRGSVGRADAETAAGDLIGMVYGGGGGAKSSGTVKKQDTHTLTRHQAQLLLFVLPASRRLELLCNVQLFSAICALAQDDIVVVKLKKGFQPCLVKSLIQIGKKDKPGVLQMLGFELELVVRKGILLAIFDMNSCILKNYM